MPSPFIRYIQNEQHYAEVIFKLMIFDMETAYIGSANLTGAGMGMKSENRRNFEAGILTNDPEFVEAAINQFDVSPMFHLNKRNPL